MGMNLELNARRGAVSSYTVETHAHGVLVKAPVAVDDLVRIVDQYKGRYTEMDLAVGEHLGGFALTTKAGGKAWRKELGLTPDNPDWLKSGDCGVSARTIYAVMTLTGRPAGNPDGRIGWDAQREDECAAPGDPDDFGRCHRLLQRYPGWRPRLAEVAARFPAWGPLVREWDRLTALYERDVGTGRSAELCEAMTRLNDEGRTAVTP